MVVISFLPDAAVALMITKPIYAEFRSKLTFKMAFIEKSVKIDHIDLKAIIAFTIALMIRQTAFAFDNHKLMKSFSDQIELLNSRRRPSKPVLPLSVL